MLECKHCGIRVDGNKRCCPLCQGELSGTPEPNTEAFPKQPAPKYDRGLLRKLVNFSAIFAIAVCMVIEFSFTRGAVWIFFAVAGIISGWATISVAIRFRTRIFKNLTCLLLLLTILSFIWDHFTGAHGWSVNYVLPLCCEATMIVDLLLTWVLKAEESEYMIHLTICALYSLIPFVFLILEKVSVPLPSVICSLTAFLLIAVLVVFRSRTFFAELSRRMHI